MRECFEIEVYKGHFTFGINTKAYASETNTSS
jgi:hypothetical protein